MKMNKSIKTLLAILLLVGGASATNPKDRAEASNTVQDDEVVEPFMSFEFAKDLCLEYLGEALVSFELPVDIAEMMDQLKSNTPRKIMKIKIDALLYDLKKPESCPGFVVEIDLIKKQFCGFLEQHSNSHENIHDALISDEGHVSWILLAARTCERLADVERMREAFQKRRDELIETIEQFKLPEDIENLIENKRMLRDPAKKQEDLRVAKSCSEFMAKVDSMLEDVAGFNQQRHSSPIELDEDKQELIGLGTSFCIGILRYPLGAMLYVGEF